MSDKDILVIIPSSSFNSGSNISNDPMETWAHASNKEIESQPLGLPDDWRPPSHPFARFCFTQLCLVILGKPDLEELWQDVNHKAGWYKVMGKAMEHRGCWCQHSTYVESFDLCTFRSVLVFLACFLILCANNNPEAPIGVSGLLCFLEIYCRFSLTLTISDMKIEDIWAHKRRKRVILNWLAISRLADLYLALSWAFLVSCVFGLLLGVKPEKCWMLLAGACMLTKFLNAVFKRNMRAMIQRG
ncbi:hypothetical protein DFJ58DRAFT_736588 [Suillus subalutaceus]|uniref:uncharacterized protein n=1 Tax=Suillus subalutaceus TaxID=48586 RepID=UPI001B86196B|nr:uncharacterized protein DFJ58DRAFT_736588 [Suillus subalutaceus]KAG1831656.1 hypothetical protein DFJ58DRAFT_736588 [Suillus subalutaceus]